MTRTEGLKTEFKAILRVREAYRRCAALMDYDAMTCAPAGSAAGAARTRAILAAEEHKLVSGGEYAELLSGLLARREELDEITLREAEEERKALDRLRRVPAELWAEHRRITGEASAAWREAKLKNDYSLFAPKLEAVFSSARRVALAAAPGEDPYAYWLDSNEEGMTEERLDGFFSLIKRELVPLIERISKKQKPDDSFLHLRYPKEEQKRFSREVMHLMGIDPDRCTLAEAEHPYTTFISRSDVRMTTHYYEHFVTANMFSILHEGGHALYELGVSPELDGSPLAHGASAGMHESQSRLYENLIGRSEAFSKLIFPILAETFPEQLRGVTREEFFRAVNRVEPTLKRTEADELTYCLHVIIRYEMERALIRGELSAAEAPDRWRKLCGEYLGVDVPSDREGILQDMHWGSGLIGYFPTYALGNAYGAQIYAALRRSLDADSLIEAGRIPEVTAWLAERVHCRGKLDSPRGLILRACGEEPDPKIYIDFLKEKYTRLYS